MNKIGEDIEEISILTVALKESSLIQLKFKGFMEGLHQPLMIDPSTSKTFEGWVISSFEVTTSNFESIMVVNTREQKHEFLIKQVSQWSLWVHNPNFIVKFFKLEYIDGNIENLMWWLINLSNNDPDDIFYLKSEAKVILWQPGEHMDDGIHYNPNNESIIEFEHGFASIHPELRKEYSKMYNQLLNNN